VDRSIVSRPRRAASTLLDSSQPSALATTARSSSKR